MVQATGTGMADGRRGAGRRPGLLGVVLWASFCLPASAAELEVSAAGGGAALADAVVSLHAAQASSTTPATVSYTPLDVYQRQPLR